MTTETGRAEIVDIYPLSPLQQGMLFHAVYDGERQAYFEQATFTLRGPIRPEFLRRALDETIRHYTILRTIFAWEGLDEPMQVVLGTYQPNFEYEDLRTLDVADQEARIGAVLQTDRQTPFAFAEEPPHRTRLLQCTDDRAKLVISFHHLLFDGWSVFLFLRHLLGAYESLCAGNAPAFPPSRPYRDYIALLQTRTTDVEGYFRRLLAGFDTPNHIEGSFRGETSDVTRREERSIRLSEEQTAQLSAFARQHRLTLNTILQGAWAILVSSYSNSNDVVFGVTLSTRPSEFSDSEEMLGLFINTLPHRVRLDPAKGVLACLKDVQAQAVDIRAHDHTNLAQIQKWTEISGGQPLFESLIAYENYATGNALADLKFVKVEDLDVREATNYPLTLVIMPGASLQLRLQYDAQRFDAPFVDRLLEHLANVLDAIRERPNVPPGHLSFLSAQEKHRLLVEWNRTQAEYPRDASVGAVYSALARKHPEAIALVAGERTLSYGELDRQANRLAHYLRERAVKSEEPIGVCLQRSTAFVVAVLAVLKAGGAYVPLDPSYPDERLFYMLKDAGCRCVLGVKGELERLGKAGIEAIDIEESLERLVALAPGGHDEDPGLSLGGDQLAYVIYTSGSMGRPKGVMVSHSGVLRIAMNAGFAPLGIGDTMAHLSNVSFDAATWEVWAALLNGARVAIFDKDEALSGTLGEKLRARGVTAMFNTTALFHRLADDAPETFASLRHMLFGGELVDIARVQRVLERGRPERLLHVYGPTECVTYSSWHEIERIDIGARTIPIGRGVNNLRLYILDRNLNPAPSGVVGELYIGGEGLARGYQGDAQLTASRFLPDPFHVEPGNRMYRTGDLAQWNSTGAVEFVGRADRQVKIRGFRIEPGEIESVLRQHPAVRDAAVEVFAENGRKLLHAYAACPASTTATDLRAFVAQRLPDYMVPTGFVVMERLPITPNGKIDRRALPAPNVLPREITAARNDIERTLCAIWSELLHVPDVGIHDNYFELGGDSIITLAITSRAREAGFSLTPKLIFQNPTIAGIAQVVATRQVTGPAETSSEGSIPLTPIQSWFFELGLSNVNHFAQTLHIELRRPISQDVVSGALAAIVEQHGALRLRFRKREDGSWTHECVAPNETYPVNTLDLASEPDFHAALVREARSLASSLDISAGPLLRATLVRGGEGATDRLILAIHHLAVDVVSWGILLNDLERACIAIEKGETVSFPAPTASWKGWAESLAALAHDDSLLKELPYWQAQCGRDEIPVDIVGGKATVSSRRTVTVELDTATTAALVTRANRAYDTRPLDLLLAAFARTMRRFTSSTSVGVLLERHGREEIAEGIDVSRTIGWFTALTPIRLSASSSDFVSDIRSTRVCLATMPRGGLGYGLLRHMHGDPSIAASLSATPTISFNYLGRAEGLGDSNAFRLIEELGDASVSPNGIAPHVFDLVCAVKDEKLRVEWQFSADLHAPATIERLVASYVAEIAAVVAHCLDTSRSRLPDTLVLDAERVEDAYPLSSLQEGLLFHERSGHGGQLYIEQIRLRLEGPLDVAHLEAALGVVVARHTALRTLFARDRAGEPLQIVVRDFRAPFRTEDLAALEPTVRDATHDVNLANERSALDPFRAPPFRAYVGRFGAHTAELALTFHHVLLDGWSVSLVVNQFVEAYQSLVAGKPVVVGKTRPYRDFIEWIGRHPPQAEAFFRDMLAGFDAEHRLPAMPKGNENGGEGQRETHNKLDARAVAAVKALAQRERVTMNAVFQAALALVLGRYMGTSDVVFGVTVAGRPYDLAGVEGIVGLFINTLPLRLQWRAKDSVSTFIAATHEASLSLRQHEHASLAEAQRISGAGHDLFETLFVFENYPFDPSFQEIGNGLRVTDIPSKERSNYPLNVVVELTDGIVLHAIYDAERLGAGFGEAILDRVTRVLLAMSESISTRIGDLPFLSEEERQSVLYTWNETRAEYPRSAALGATFAALARRQSEAIALVDGDGHLTYGDLERRANRFAHRLLSLDLRPEEPIGVCLERSMSFIIAVLGIVKAGAVYVPLDPTYPDERLSYMVEDAGCRYLLAQRSLCGRFALRGLQVMSIEDELERVVHADPSAHDEDPGVAAGGSQLAYIIYTSGSTGRPKGVMSSHGGVLRLAMNNGFSAIGPDDVVAHMSNLSFDITTWEIWSTLLNGGRISVFGRDEALTLDIGRKLRERGVTAVCMMTPLFNHLVDHAPETFSSLRYVLFGGEVVDPMRVRRLLQRKEPTRLVHGYGPTECVTCASWHEVHAVEEGAITVPIGRGASNLRLYVLDDFYRPLPVGLPGELFVGGEGLARGYRNKPGLTAFRFVPDPFAPDPGGRMYRTGDIVRWNAEGAIEFVGRVDTQVKIRGYRIEPGEIEAVLRERPEVTDAVVVVRGDGSDKRLVAYVVARDANGDAAIRAHLRERLPDYMAPSDIVLMERLPITPSGKVDRAALPNATPAKARASVTAPPSALAAGLLRIFSEVLGREDISIHDDFFELGGHSLLATRIISRVRSVFQVDIPLRDLFADRTVARLAVRIETARGQVRLDVTVPIGLASREGDLPLSFGQQRIWFLSRMEEAASRAYHVVAAYRIKGPLDEGALTSAFTDILARHESLRTAFPAIGGRPRQVINPPEPFPIEMADLPSEVESNVLDERLADIARRPFDMSQGPLVRGAILRTGPDARVFVLAMHHIVVDGWSLGVLFGEIAALYDAYRRGETSPLAPLRIQYADYAAWQATQFEGAAMDRLLAYWKNQLGPEPPVLELPTDRPRPKYLSYSGRHHLFQIPPALVDQVHALARARGITDFMLLLAAFQILLCRYTEQTDFTIGTPVAGRSHADVEPLVGFFVNTLVLRARLSANDTFIDVLERARDTTLGAYDHQDMPFERLVDALVSSRSLGRTPLCQVIFSFERQTPIRLAGIEATPVEVPSDTARMDWTFVLSEDSHGISGRLEYNTDLFLPATAARVAEHFVRLLEGLVVSPSTRIGEFSLMPVDERTRVVEEWNRTQAEYPRDAAIGAVFSAQARKHPDAVALVDGERTLSYGELDRLANRLAHHLLNCGVQPEEPIGVCMQRSMAFVVTILAILKAGGAYVPLDPSYPDERLAYMLKDAGCRRVLGVKGELARFGDGYEAVDVDATLEQLGVLQPSLRDDDPGVALGGDQLAYMMYTSGSTGRPKGAMIAHRGVLRIALNNGFAQLGPGDAMAHISNVSFDAATWEIWGTLLSGARLVVFHRDEALGGQFGALLRQREVSAMFVTAALFNRLVDEAGDTFATVTHLVVGGDALDVVRVRKALDAGHRGRLLNGYGPTECVTFSAWHEARDLDKNALSVPIGRGVNNLRLYVLDRDLNPTPIGLPGELYVAGDGIARGYAHNAGFSASRFVPDPFSLQSGGRMYRTGDIARWNIDGVVEFVGRVDNQVKIRGFRIEPGEVEAVLREHPAIKDAIVLVKGAGAEKHLVAYVASPEKPEEATLRAFLRNRLPDYMMPAAFCVLDALPLSPGGKIDRAALPEPNRAGAQGLAKPRDAAEESIARIFAEVLERENIGIHDNFFELGGHSLLATQVVSRVRKAFGKNLSLRTFFEAPTIAELAKRLAEEGGLSPEASKPGIKKLARPVKRGKP